MRMPDEGADLGPHYPFKGDVDANVIAVSNRLLTKLEARPQLLAWAGDHLVQVEGWIRAASVRLSQRPATSQRPAERAQPQAQGADAPGVYAVYDKGSWRMTIGRRHYTASGRLTAVWTGKLDIKNPHKWSRAELVAELPHMQSEYQQDLARSLIQTKKWSESDDYTASDLLFENSIRATGPDIRLRPLGPPPEPPKTDYTPGNVLEEAEATKGMLQDELSRFLPFVSTSIGTLGGKEQPSVTLRVSLDPKNKWANGIFQNSRHGLFMLSWPERSIEYFSGHGLPKFRKAKFKTPQEAVRKLTEHLSGLGG
jgi:hypothetical protein